MIQIRFGHIDFFKDLPGQVLFMMVLDICNASADQDIKAATTVLFSLSLSSYAGGDIEEFVT